MPIENCNPDRCTVILSLTQDIVHIKISVDPYSMEELEELLTETNLPEADEEEVGCFPMEEEEIPKELKELPEKAAPEDELLEYSS